MNVARHVAFLAPVEDGRVGDFFDVHRHAEVAAELRRALGMRVTGRRANHGVGGGSGNAQHGGALHELPAVDLALLELVHQLGNVRMGRFVFLSS